MLQVDAAFVQQARHRRLFGLWPLAFLLYANAIYRGSAAESGFAMMAAGS